MFNSCLLGWLNRFEMMPSLVRNKIEDFQNISAAGFGQRISHWRVKWWFTYQGYCIKLLMTMDLLAWDLHPKVAYRALMIWPLLLTSLQLLLSCPLSPSHKQLTFHIRSPTAAAPCAQKALHTDIRFCSHVIFSVRFIVTHPLRVAVTTSPNTPEGFFSSTFIFLHNTHLSCTLSCTKL